MASSELKITAKDRAYEFTKGRVLDATYAGGDLLTEGEVADALGITERQLFLRLRAGRTLAQIAKAEGKDLAEVKAAATSAAKERLDAAVEEGDLTQAQADEILEHLDEHLDRLATDGLPRFPGRDRGFRHGPPSGFGG